MKQTQVTLNDIVSKPETIISADLDGGIVMMSIEKGQYYKLNTIGSTIWKLIEKPIAVTDICDQLMAEFEVSKQQCQEEVLNYLTKLLELDNVKIVEKSS